MTTREKTTEVPEAQAPPAPDGWAIGMDREIPIRDGVALCEKLNVSLSGSTFEKALRETRRLDHRNYLGGKCCNDRKLLQIYAHKLTELRGRRGGLIAHSRPAGEVDAAIASLEHNIAIVRSRVDAADHSDCQPARREKVDAARRILDGLENERRGYAGFPVPEELEERIDEGMVNLDAAEAAFAAGADDLGKLVAAQQTAEREARAGLATVLRTRVLEVIAQTVRQAMPPERVALHLRRPERALPPEVQAGLREAEHVASVADSLDAAGRGILPFAVLLGEDLCGLFFPSLEWPELRRWRRRRAAQDQGVLKNEPLMDATL